MECLVEQQPRALAIRRAAAVVGGVGPLAEQLKVPEGQVDCWMRDIGNPPDKVFLDVIAIIIEKAGTRARRERDPAYAF